MELYVPFSHPERPPKPFCTKLKSLSVSNIEACAHDSASERATRPCFAAECGASGNGCHTSQPVISLTQSAYCPASIPTWKERPCFAAECGLDRLGHTWTPDGLEQPHEKNGPVLLQNVAPTPLGTHEHSRVHFSILRLRTQFRTATRKGRPCSPAECGLARLGHTGTLEALEQPQKNGPVLLQNVAPTLLGTHEHSRAHFSILKLRTQSKESRRV